VCHESTSESGMRSVLSHAIQRERPELHSLSFSLKAQCNVALYYGLLFKYCSNACEFCLINWIRSKFLLNE